MPESRFEIESNLPAVSKLGENIKYFCSTNSIPNQDGDLIRVALIEAMNNIVKHAYKYQTEKKIFLNILFENNLFEAKIIDYGEEFFRKEKNESMEISRNNIDSIPENGMGTELIDKIMDSVEYFRETDKNILILRKYINT